MTIRIEVHGAHNAATAQILRGAASLGIDRFTDCRISKIYFLSHDVGASSIERLCDLLLVDPVTEDYTWFRLAELSDDHTSRHNFVEVALRPGVTDVSARELRRGMSELGLPPCQIQTATCYELFGDHSENDLQLLARHLLCNETIQHYSLGRIPPHFAAEASASDRVEIVHLAGLDDDELVKLSRDRLLSLDLQEMRAIQSFYGELQRPPTDVELETLAQTWSEHCVHKTFRARIDFTWLDAEGNTKQHEEIDGLLRQYIRAATNTVAAPWLRSAFVDDAGIIAFDDEYDLAFKVETHNHPSALEPFGGANTGIGGVVRDILGVSARPIATTDVLCFGPQDFPHHLLPQGVLHPQRVAQGVVAGIADYGNKLGLPTVSGAVLYDEGYLGNPLVFCGCAGILPAGSHPTQPQPGDLVVVLGGKTGRDGLHGATFSSIELTHETSETSGSAVQIGDPITEKGLFELIEAARDEQLYNAITDCGAGGLSSAVGEMGSKVGADVELTNVALKYPGLVPWEIWLSEAQERMVLAVPPPSLDRLKSLAQLWDVELSVLGKFSGDGDLRVRYEERIVAEMPMEFLHDGIPQKRLTALWQSGDVVSSHPPTVTVGNYNDMLLRMLAWPSVASKEEIIRRYDHEVRGGTLVRPLIGPQMDGPSDAAVLKPLGTWRHNRAFSLSLGINPEIGRLDPYAMAISAIDEAVRNAVAVGADPDQIAILDNFCWGNPTLPDRLGALVRACQGCYDGAVAYRTPFISGKDSLYNEYNGEPIPGTLLISAIGIVPDMNHCVTAGLKQAGNRLYLLGESKPELGGSLFCKINGTVAGAVPTMPERPLTRYRLLHRAMQNDLVQACHDLSEGGLALALAEMSLSGRLGLEVTLPEDALSPVESLFGESNGRLLVEVRPQDAVAFEDALSGQSLLYLGEVTSQPRLVIYFSSDAAVDLPVEQLVAAWKRLQHGVAP